MRPSEERCRKFSQTFANQIRRCRPKPGKKWYLDEVRIEIKGEVFWLWRAVDEDGSVLDYIDRFISEVPSP
jgi:putative transposase